jgi:hypothetical protein
MTRGQNLKQRQTRYPRCTVTTAIDNRRPLSTMLRLDYFGKGLLPILHLRECPARAYSIREGAWASPTDLDEFSLLYPPLPDGLVLEDPHNVVRPLRHELEPLPLNFSLPYYLVRTSLSNGADVSA